MRALRAARSERGETLVELLMTITIAGIALSALLAGLATAINASSRHRGQASADVVLVSAAESVKSQAYVSCPGVTTSSYNPTQGVDLPSGWSASNVTIVSVLKWNGTEFESSCPGTDEGEDGDGDEGEDGDGDGDGDGDEDGEEEDQDLQLVTIRVTTPDGRSSEEVSVVKRDPS